MFDRKRTSIYEVTPKVTKGSGVNAPKFENIFQREAYKMEHETTSGNGSLKYDTSGNVFVDDFAAIGNYRKPREFAEVSQTMERLWAVDPLTAIKEAVYIRLITRNPKLFTGKKLGV